MNRINSYFYSPDSEIVTQNLAEFHQQNEIAGVKSIKNSLAATSTLKEIASNATAEYILLFNKTNAISLGQFALERFIRIAEDTQASMVYSDYQVYKEGLKQNIPVNDYQLGSLRDDFNFGSLWLIPTKDFKRAVESMTIEYQFAALYDLRLKLSQKGDLVHLNEYLYTDVEADNRKSGEKQFDYVDPRNRAVQIEMEAACTEHLKIIGGFLKPEFEKVDFSQSDFPVEVSVIIPVRNRVRTIKDAVESVLVQKTAFNFNLIIVDNFSTDGTTELIKEYAVKDKRLIHIVPNRDDLGIGGCWNEGVFSAHCGKFAVQLDSDDVYQDENTLTKIVEAFYTQNCAMVVGSYTMTNFQMETIAPGLIDHKEWTPDNGRNNALRINGLGAPRAFYTPVLREVKVPNTSYGEDYALGLAISRKYQIGRIYDSLYLCRRWDDNSDASLDIVKLNAHNAYKDKIRTVELMARIQKNKL